MCRYVSVDDSSLYIDNSYTGKLMGVVASDMQHGGINGNTYVDTVVLNRQYNQVLRGVVDANWGTVQGWSHDGMGVVTSNIRFHDDMKWNSEKTFVYGSQSYIVRVFNNCTYGSNEQSLLTYARGTYHGKLSDWYSLLLHLIVINHSIYDNRVHLNFCAIHFRIRCL